MMPTGELSVEEIAALVSGAPEVEELEQAMTLVRENGRSILQLLHAALKRLPEITARSYRHPNGFAKIVIHEAGPRGTSVRLHVWPAVANASREDIASRRDSAPHGHRWNFASTVIAGSGLFVEDFDVVHLKEGDTPTDGEQSWEAFLFQPAVSATLIPNGNARLRCREYWIRDPIRDIYWCDTRDVHTIGPIDGGMTATLVLQGPEVEPTAPVYRRPDGPPDPGRRPLDETAVAGLILAVIRDIEGVEQRTRTTREEPVPRLSIAVGPSRAELDASSRPTL